jgi:hypothetical protein
MGGRDRGGIIRWRRCWRWLRRRWSAGLGLSPAAGDLAFAGHGGDDDAPLIPVRVDGKTVRGARNPDGSQVHLLAALAGRA